MLISPLLQAGDLAAPTVAKFVRILVSASGASKAACADREVASELATLGVPVEEDGKVVWAGSAKDVARHLKPGRLVICGSLEQLGAGAAVALVNEGGRPTIYLNMKNLAASGISLPDSILKISKVVK